MEWLELVIYHNSLKCIAVALNVSYHEVLMLHVTWRMTFTLEHFMLHHCTQYSACDKLRVSQLCWSRECGSDLCWRECACCKKKELLCVWILVFYTAAFNYLYSLRYETVQWVCDTGFNTAFAVFVFWVDPQFTLPVQVCFFEETTELISWDDLQSSDSVLVVLEF